MTIPDLQNMQTAPADVVRGLRDSAQREAAASRLLTDMRFGPDYESITAEQTIQWSAADLIERRAAEIDALRSAFRVNMLKHTSCSHAEITTALDELAPRTSLHERGEG